MTDEISIGYMLDTNIFNALLDGQWTLPSKHTLFITGVQRGELAATRNEVRRDQLLAELQDSRSETVPAASFTFDVEGAGLDQAYWNDGTGRFEQMLEALRMRDAKNGKRSKRVIAGPEDD